MTDTSIYSFLVRDRKNGLYSGLNALTGDCSLDYGYLTLPFKKYGSGLDYEPEALYIVEVPWEFVT